MVAVIVVIDVAGAVMEVRGGGEGTMGGGGGVIDVSMIKRAIHFKDSEIILISR